MQLWFEGGGEMGGVGFVMFPKHTPLNECLNNFVTDCFLLYSFTTVILVIIA